MGHEWVGDGTGARVRKLRVEQGRTKRDLAREIGVTQETIYKIETGQVKASMPTLRKLSQVLGVPVYYLGCFESLPEDSFGQKFTKARNYHGLTKREAALKMSVAERTICNWENGRVCPSNDLMEKIEEFISILGRKQ
jgi:DNA-binding XRE family transcriptional regulator